MCNIAFEPNVCWGRLEVRMCFADKLAEDVADFSRNFHVALIWCAGTGVCP